ncbi:hypothetical protein ACFYZT_04970 [Streptomyces sp. NPDC001591]|uniref:hypothetical protein n=1 Tax=Streptomyces sp. NPDC001591 TaxID=3364589 RepID=UPI0036CA8062
MSRANTSKLVWDAADHMIERGASSSHVKEVFMLTGKLRLAVIAALASLLIGGASAATTAASARDGDTSAGTAVPGVAPSGSDASAVYLDGAGRVIDMDAVDDSGTTRHAAALGCTPVSGRDNPHRSSTGVTASGHGWWQKENCSNDRAKVFTCLYEWYTDNTWR